MQIEIKYEQDLLPVGTHMMKLNEFWKYFGINEHEFQAWMTHFLLRRLRPSTASFYSSPSWTPSFGIYFSFSTKSRTRSKSRVHSKYNAQTNGKPKSSTKSTATKLSNDNNPLYEAPSLSSYHNSETCRSGWNGVFQRCYALLSHNPFGITSMMRSYNTITNSTGLVIFGAVFYCSLYSIYSFPSSWFFAWFTLRVFTDIFPLFPIVYGRIIDEYVMESFPIIKYLRFSRKLPNPELQSVGSILKERMEKTQELKRKRGEEVAEEEGEQDLDDVVFTDEQLAKSSVMANWKVKSRSHAKRYGLSWDVVENTCTLVTMPMFMVMFYVVGIGDPLIEILLQNDNLISNFLARNEWIVKYGTAHAVSTYLNRLVAVPVFRFWSVPRAFDTYGPLNYR